MTQKEHQINTDTAISVVFECLVATLQGELYPETLDQVKKDVLNKVHSTTLRGVIFDMSAVRMLDSYSFECLVKIVKTVKLLGVEAVFAGLQPGVVSSIVELDIDFEGFRAFFDLEDGLNYLGVKSQESVVSDDDDFDEYDNGYFDDGKSPEAPEAPDKDTWEVI